MRHATRRISKKLHQQIVVTESIDIDQRGSQHNQWWRGMDWVEASISTRQNPILNGSVYAMNEFDLNQPPVSNGRFIFHTESGRSTIPVSGLTSPTFMDIHCPTGASGLTFHWSEPDSAFKLRKFSAFQRGEIG